MVFSDIIDRPHSTASAESESLPSTGYVPSTSITRRTRLHSEEYPATTDSEAGYFSESFDELGHEEFGAGQAEGASQVFNTISNDAIATSERSKFLVLESHHYSTQGMSSLANTINLLELTILKHFI